MKHVLIVLFSILCLVGSAHCMDVATSSGEQTTTGVVTGRCALTAAEIITDGTNDATLVIRDGGASGTVIFEGKIAGGNFFGGRTWDPALKINNNVYCTISGTGATYIIEYITDWSN